MISQLAEGLFDHRKEWRRVLSERVPFDVRLTAGSRLSPNPLSTLRDTDLSVI